MNVRVRIVASLWVVGILASPVLAQERPAPKRTPDSTSKKANLVVPDSVEIERDVEYGRAGERVLHLDIVRPREPKRQPLPVIAFIHGGGWRGGNKSSALPRLVSFAATGEYFGVSIGYRLSGEAIWPAQIHDCKAAIRWLRANASRLGIDPNRIGVWGSSAGGHLVSLLGTSGDIAALEGNNGSPDQSSRVACVVDFCGPSDFLTFGKDKKGVDPESATAPIALLLGGPVSQRPEVAKAASPASYVSKDDPPFLIVYGTDDATVPISQAVELAGSLEKVGAPVRFVRIEGGGHGFGGPQVDERVTTFFSKHLLGKDVEVSSQPIAARP